MKWRVKRAFIKTIFISLIAVAFIAAASFTRPSLKPPQAPEVTQAPQADKNSPKTMKLSLWLMPPPHVATALEQRISFYSKTSGGPYFDPHVTVLGDITCESRDHATKIVSVLQQDLSGFGEIDAVFHPKAQNLDAWNQALVVEMVATPKFVELCERVRELLQMDSTTGLFPPPLRAPHMSLFYGVDNVPKAEGVEAIPNFNSDTLALWITEPTYADGVHQWEFLDNVFLV
ncbi:unnamed protein product [Cylindrotheca closterium]|uniref:2',3'-cyclic-nucleotide 3'-phosphodiesterase n=1 Tax=Cylindrotheca closterium TaxID=2856 RepID=A0AAD2CL26_9STRA|nr:unnamed protein product [Cylindrotheca closterium]